MDYEVIWADEALCDIEEIAKYIEDVRYRVR